MSSSVQSSFSKFLQRGRPVTVSVEETHSYQRTKKRVNEATAAVAGVAVSVAHDLLSTGVDLLQLASIPALGTAGSVLLSIWEAVQLIEINRVACLRLTERCAETLLSIRQEIDLAGTGASPELDEPMGRLNGSFQDIHKFLLKQKRRTFLHRYLKREDDQREINDCNSSLDSALSMFSIKIQIRMLILMRESEARRRESETQRQEDSRLLTSLVTSLQPSSTQTVNTELSDNGVLSVTSAEIDQLEDPVKVRWLLCNHMRAQSERDRNTDLVDLRKLLNAALQEKSDVAMIEVLQIGRDEMPEAISTLQHVLQHDAEAARQHTQPTDTPIRDAVHSSNTSAAHAGMNTRGSILDPFDRNFIATGIEALSRLSLNQCTDIKVPSWTITRHEIDLWKKIGKGHFSDVYKGQCREQTVAIKLLADTTSRKLFVREVNVWIQLQHPHVLQLLGASSTTSDPPWFLISPYYAHGNVVDYLKGLDSDAALDQPTMMREIAEGMVYLHGKGIVHGDLKGSNILIDDQLHCIVSDFGQSEMNSEVYRLSSLTVSRGTLRWQSPELMRGMIIRLTPEVDIYAFAILCTEILTQGGLPWPLHDDHAVRHFVCDLGRRPDLPPSYPPAHPISVIIQSAWHLEARLRPSFQEIAQQFKSLRAALRMHTPPTASTMRQNEVPFQLGATYGSRADENVHVMFPPRRPEVRNLTSMKPPLPPLGLWAECDVQVPRPRLTERSSISTDSPMRPNTDIEWTQQGGSGALRFTLPQANLRRFNPYAKPQDPLIEGGLPTGWAGEQRTTFTPQARLRRLTPYSSHGTPSMGQV